MPAPPDATRPMANTAYYWDERSLMHDTGAHVERVARAERLHPDRLRGRVPKLNARPVVDPDAAQWVLRVHEKDHFDRVRRICAEGGGLLDEGDTHAGPRSLDAALAAVSMTLSAGDGVMAREVDNAFCVTRPPGHHALPGRAMGFCLFNNVAILARYLEEKHRVGRIAIVDFDVHHGNGTQDVFWRTPEVLFVSAHQHPLWPGSGLAGEQGAGAGLGATVNIPIAADTSEADYLDTFEAGVLPAVDRFAPEVLLVSAGFDAHADDPLAQLNLTERGYAKITLWLTQLAADHAEGRLISLLEGGYALDALERSVAAHVEALMSA